MTENTSQIKTWKGEFGRNYTDRNTLSLEELDALYLKNYGLTRTELNLRFLGNIDRTARILEVGSNTGNQLLCLKKMGFENLFGVELQRYAVELSRERIKGVDIMQGSAFDIPFKNRYFDLVFTSGVLIHIHPLDIAKALTEIHRCANRYIMGFEYYSDEYIEVPYRGHNNLLWKADFARQYLDRFDDLELFKEERIKYLDSENVDSMFMLRKKGQQ